MYMYPSCLDIFSQTCDFPDFVLRIYLRHFSILLVSVENVKSKESHLLFQRGPEKAVDEHKK